LKSVCRTCFTFMYHFSLVVTGHFQKAPGLIAEDWKCPVTTSEKWYMNVKQVRQTDFNTNSCTLTGGCEVCVQIQGY